MNKKDKINHYARAANDVRDAVIILSRIGDQQSKEIVAKLRPILRNDAETGEPGLDNIIAEMVKEESE